MDDLGSRTILGLTGVVMALLTISTMLSDQLADLPVRTLLFALGSCVAVLGVGISLTGVTEERREWMGAALAGYALVRGIAHAIRAAERTNGIGEWFSESAPVWALALFLMQGFLVWVRAHREP
jgi:hypothetical protein